jgi:exodeoxyribonuclease V gamma subunit
LQQHQLTQQQIEYWLSTGRSDALPWQLSGSLPLASFAELNATALQQTSEHLWQAWQSLVANYSQRLASLPLSLTLTSTTLSGQLDLLYANEQNEHYAVQLVPGSLKSKSGIKAHKLIDAWLAHCLANASEQSVTSAVIGTDMSLRFLPIAPTQARLCLQAYVELYQQAWQQPLKVACKSGIAYVQSLQQQQAKQVDSDTGLDTQLIQEKALAAARSEFEGGFGRSGEWEQSLTLQRCFTSFDALQPEFTTLSQQLYGAMLERVIIG